MCRWRPYLTGVVLCVLAGACPWALADGAFIPPEYGTADSADQRAVIIDQGASETLILETAYQGDLSAFAWVVPLPGRIQGADIGVADQNIFGALESLTAPRAWLTQGGVVGGCGGCGGGDSDAGGAPGGENRAGVNVWETLQVAGFEVAILSAAQSADLAQWLADNGYAMPPGQQATLQYYVDRGAFFVAIKVAPDQAAAPAQADGTDHAALEPLRLTFPKAGGQLVFPLRISQASSKGETEVRLFVLADHRVRSANYPTAQVAANGFDGRQEFAQWYDARFRQKLRDLGGRAFVVEYAGPLPEWGVPESLREIIGERELFVTRLRSYLAPEQMTEDVSLVRAANDAEFNVDLVVGAALGYRPGVALAALLLAVVQSRRALTRRGRNGARLAALLGIAAMLL